MVRKDPAKKRTPRARGDGAVFQRCERQYGCPEMVPLLDEGGQAVLTTTGKPKMIRPVHDCRGMWIGQLDLGYKDGTDRRTGRPRRVPNRPTVSARTKLGAIKKLNDLKDVVKKTGGTAPEKGLTVEKWFRYWLDEIVNVRPRVWADYKSVVEKHIIPGIGHHRLDKLQPEHLRALYKAMDARGDRGRRPNAHRRISTALAAAEKEGKVTRNVAKLVPTPSGAGGKRKSIGSANARALLSATARAEDRLQSRWAMALLAGARQGECLGLEWDRVNLDAEYADIEWQLQRLPWSHGCEGEDGQPTCGKKRGGNCPQRTFRLDPDYEHRQLDGGLCLVRPKSDAGWRRVPLVPTVSAALRRRWELYEAERGRYQVDHGLVWCRPDGRPIPPDVDNDAWDDACQLAGIPPADLHEARNTTATLLLEAGVDVKIIEAILGHADAATSRAYQTVDLGPARDALMKAERLLELPASSKE